jgi:hypothetical protein
MLKFDKSQTTSVPMCRARMLKFYAGEKCIRLCHKVQGTFENKLIMVIWVVTSCILVDCSGHRT